MTAFTPPCAGEGCPRSPDPGSTRRLCRDMGEIIINAGGAGLLEVNRCPWDALMVVGPEQDNPVVMAVRGKLGITHYSEGNDLD